MPFNNQQRRLPGGHALCFDMTSAHTPGCSQGPRSNPMHALRCHPTLHHRPASPEFAAYARLGPMPALSSPFPSFSCSQTRPSPTAPVRRAAAASSSTNLPHRAPFRRSRRTVRRAPSNTRSQSRNTCAPRRRSRNHRSPSFRASCPRGAGRPGACRRDGGIFLFRHGRQKDVQALLVKRGPVIQALFPVSRLLEEQPPRRRKRELVGRGVAEFPVDDAYDVVIRVE